jgi:transcription initiation factor IIE alpha subunit
MFARLFGGGLFGKLLDFLADHVDFDYTVAQMHQFTGIKKDSLYRLIRELKEERIIMCTRMVGRSKYYRLNMSDPRVVSLFQTAHEFLNKGLASIQIKDKSAKSTDRKPWMNN